MSANKLPSVTIAGPVLSDLFFNTEHKSFDAFCENTNSENLTSELYAAARKRELLEDALAFLFDLGLDAHAEHNGENLADLLVEDFLNRL